MTARFWILTIPEAAWTPPPTLPAGVTYLKGQKECGAGGFVHWQVVVRTRDAVRLGGCKALFCPEAHCERTRSAAALDYVWKEDTRVAGSQFELGELRARGNQTDWKEVVEQAKTGDFDAVDPGVLVRYSGSIFRIHAHYAVPEMRPGVRTMVYWGPTHTGKTHRSAEEASATGSPIYWKSSTTKWWDGYRGQPNVIIDEFDGQIGIIHLLRWLDKFPTIVEVKGGSTPLCAVRFWITSNQHPTEWFKDAPAAQVAALFRRLTIEEVAVRYEGNEGGESPDLI